jgi:hypothetical protein
VNGYIGRDGFDSVEGVSGQDQHFDHPSGDEHNIETRFTYTTLGFFKVETKMQCLLESVNNLHLDKSPSHGLENSVQYAAISYAWGEIKLRPVKTILLNGRIFEIESENRWLASGNLQLLCRQRNLPSLDLWIDAICIDQKEQGEKGPQVQNMHVVYRHASGIIVWLGVPAQDSDRAFDFMERIEKDVRAKSGTTDEEPGATLADSILRVSAKHLISSDYLQAWVALHNLLARPWWTRCLTLPEVVMGTTVADICGTHMVSWPVVAI